MDREEGRFGRSIFLPLREVTGNGKHRDSVHENQNLLSVFSPKKNSRKRISCKLTLSKTKMSYLILPLSHMVRLFWNLSTSILSRNLINYEIFK